MPADCCPETGDTGAGAFEATATDCVGLFAAVKNHMLEAVQHGQLIWGERQVERRGKVRASKFKEAVDTPLPTGWICDWRKRADLLCGCRFGVDGFGVFAASFAGVIASEFGAGCGSLSCG